MTHEKRKMSEIVLFILCPMRYCRQMGHLLHSNWPGHFLCSFQLHAQKEEAKLNNTQSQD